MAYIKVDPELWITIAYLRRSREDAEAERYGWHETLAKQRRLIEFTAKEEYEREVEHWFEEIESGETISGRPEFRRLLNCLIKDKWESKKQGMRMAVFVKEASRLGRGGGADRDRIINVIKKSRTYVITPDKIYDPENAKDMKLLKKELEDATDEKDASVERMQGGIKDAVMAGCYLYLAPYGWERKRINRQWTLVPNEEQQERIFIMLDLIEHEDYSVGEIKKHNEEQGWLTARGSKVWSKTALRDIFSSRLILRGEVSHGKHATVEEVDEETFDSVKVKRVVDDYLVADGLHPALISEERFQLIQRKIHKSQHNYRHRGLQNYWSGIIVCGKCGFSMIRRPQGSKRYKSVKLNGKPYVRFEHSENHDCDCKGAPWYDVEEAIIFALKVKYAEYEVLLTDEGKQRDRERIEKRIAALEADLRKAHVMRTNIFEMRETGEYTRAEFEERRNAIDERIAKIEESIEREGRSLPEEDHEIAERMVTCAEIIDTLQDESVSNDDKNAFLKEWIDRIDYYNDAPRRTRHNELRLEIFFVWDTTS